jgi:hypothetical protein
MNQCFGKVKRGTESAANAHSWRHAFARLYLLDGGDLGTLSRILGHSDVSTTVDFYAVYCIEELQRKHQQHSPISQMFGGEEDDGMMVRKERVRFSGGYTVSRSGEHYLSKASTVGKSGFSSLS